jgi:hypothetical protein
VLLLALVHGFVAGTDSREALVRAMYASTGAGIFGVTVFWLTYEYRKPRPAAAAGIERPARAPRPEQRAPAAEPAPVLDLAATKVERARIDEPPPRLHGSRH